MEGKWNFFDPLHAGLSFPELRTHFLSPDLSAKPFYDSAFETGSRLQSFGGNDDDGV